MLSWLIVYNKLIEKFEDCGGLVVSVPIRPSRVRISLAVVSAYRAV